MADNEPARLGLDLVEPAVALVLLDELVAESLVRPVGHQALLIEHREHARPLGLQQVHGVLVVGEVQRIPVDAFPLIELLLQLENEGVEELLKTLVREVDAELLEGVELEALEAENIEHAHEKLHVLLVSDRPVRDFHNVVEDQPVEGLCQGVAVVGRLRHLHRAPDLAARDGPRGVADRLFERLSADPGELGRHLDRLGALRHHLGALAVVGRRVKLGIAKIQHCADDVHDRVNVVPTEANCLHGSDSDLEHLDIVHVLQRLARGAREKSKIGQVGEAGQVHRHLLLDFLLRQPLGKCVR
mmetsp:Transcript_112857/g.320084  ORF Transcript_112857/g.320084 Transcript_112857/m.320084 type:complete len:301 (+) Transcript_112857:3479-4381(+)